MFFKRKAAKLYVKEPSIDEKIAIEKNRNILNNELKKLFDAANDNEYKIKTAERITGLFNSANVKYTNNTYAIDQLIKEFTNHLWEAFIKGTNTQIDLISEQLETLMLERFIGKSEMLDKATKKAHIDHFALEGQKSRLIAENEKKEQRVREIAKRGMQQNISKTEKGDLRSRIELLEKSIADNKIIIAEVDEKIFENYYVGIVQKRIIERANIDKRSAMTLKELEKATTRLEKTTILMQADRGKKQELIKTAIENANSVTNKGNTFRNYGLYEVNAEETIAEAEVVEDNKMFGIETENSEDDFFQKRAR